MKKFNFAGLPPMGLLFVLSLSALLLSACAGLMPDEYVVSPQQLNSQFDKFFPLNSDLANGMFSTSLSAPKIGFVTGKNRVSLAAGISVSSIFSKGMNGRVALTSGLRYDATERALYLKELRIESVDIDGDTASMASQLLPLFNVMLGEYVRENPIYRFSPDELKLGPLSAEVSDMTVVDNGIRLKLRPR
ncbi:MAG: DUF1439 domain-containing protein [Gallionella sp.]